MQDFLGNRFTENQTNNWVFSPFLKFGSRLSSCGSYNLVGGFNIFGNGSYVERNFSGLPPHYSARIRLLFLKIDSWDSENFYITVDSQIIVNETFKWEDETMLLGNICGKGTFNEAEKTFSQEFRHSSPNMNVKLHTNLDQVADDESWGFSNFELVIYRCEGTCQSCTSSATNSCTLCFPNAILSNGICNCDVG